MSTNYKSDDDVQLSVALDHDVVQKCFDDMQCQCIMMPPSLWLLCLLLLYTLTMQVVQSHLVVCGQSFDVAITLFTNKTLVMVTAKGNVGSWVLLVCMYCDV